jgi:hypothetical protein
MVMLILALFGITIYAMIASGADTQMRIMGEKEAQSDARIALSYINVKLRQNDAEGRIVVKPIDLTGENAILIQEHELERDTWIFHLDGMLYESIVSPGEQPDEWFSFPIIDVEYMETSFEPITGRITNTVYYSYSGEWQYLSSSVLIRSH